MSGLGPTQPSGITQQLLIRALERGLNQLDVRRLSGRTVDVDVFVQAGNSGVVSSGFDYRGVASQGYVNQAFIKEFVVVWLKAHGVRTVTSAPNLKLKVFASVLGTDRGETFIGIPAFQAPILNVPVPEIALFKWVRNRGQSELRVFALDGRTEDFVEQLPVGVGHSKADDFTVLLFIGFSSTDIEERAPIDSPQQGGSAARGG
ncbi:MAG TPA: hypothetical protein VMS64_35085 [Candidatus Methylomirabilis sp.]|nr:hypothetical protein [Candidatus Methylomirabilis sp.]